MWPGFGENSRVLKWAIERIEGKAAAMETPIGHVPTPEALDTDGLDMDPAGSPRPLQVVAEVMKPRSRRSRSGSPSSATTSPPSSGRLDGLKARLGVH